MQILLSIFLNVTLSNAEIKLLSRGLTFVPTPRRITWSEIQADLNEFARRLRLKEYFYNPDDITNTLTNMAHPFKCKSTWTPPSGKEAALDTFINAIEQDLMSAKPTRIHDNLTKQERKAIKQLQRRMDIVIKPADKGSGTVVMDRTWYVNECMRQLNDCNFYQKQSKDLTSKIQERIRKYTSRMHNEKLIDENTFKYLTCNPNPQPGRFYILPKIHKQGNPGRPIISSNGHPTEHISEFVDFHLQPLVKTLPSHIKDTTHFLLKLQELGSLPDNAILVSLDVSSLYTNIPHKEGIDACSHYLNARHHKLVPTESLCDLIRMILGMNNLVFDGQHFLQIHGTAMGTRMAPSYANLFMGKFEEKAIATPPLSLSSGGDSSTTFSWCGRKVKKI